MLKIGDSCNVCVCSDNVGIVNLYGKRFGAGRLMEYGLFMIVDCMDVFGVIVIVL